jgi:hypothetical protein
MSGEVLENPTLNRISALFTDIRLKQKLKKEQSPFSDPTTSCP